MFNEKIKDFICFFVFLLIVFAFFHKFIVGNYIFAYKDLSRYFYPLRYLMAEQVRVGVMPLWNPFLYCGYPFLATLQIGFFYPLTIIYYFLSFDFAFNLYIIVHYYLAALFFYSMMRHFKASSAAAFISSVVFAFSGYLLSVSNMNTTLCAVVWLPLVIMFYDKLINRFSLMRLFLFSLFLVFTFLGGEPTVVYFSLLILFAYGLHKGESASQRLLYVCFLVLGVVVFLLIAAVQLLPFLEFARFSDRAVLTGYELISFRSFPIRETLTFLFPYFYGTVLRAGSYTTQILGKQIQDWVISPYVGVIPLFFVFYSIYKPNRRTIFWALIGLLGLFLAYGRYTPIHYLFYVFFPGVSYIRFPVKYIFITVFSISLLAGFGFDTFFKDFKKNSYKIIITIFVLSFCFSFLRILLSLFKSNLFRVMVLRIGKNANEIILEGLWKTIDINLYSFLYISIILFVFGFALYLFRNSLIKKNVLFFIIISVAVFDLAATNISINTASNRKVFEETPPNMAFLLKDKDLFRYASTKSLEEHNKRVYGIDFDRSLFESVDKFSANRPLVYKLFNYDGYNSMIFESHEKLNQIYSRLELNERLKILGALNVKYVASIMRLPSSYLRLVKHSDNYFYGEIFIYENKYWLPRAYLVSSYRIAQDSKAYVKILKDRTFNPRQEVILEEGLPSDFINSRFDFRGQANIVTYDYNGPKIKTNANRASILFLSDSYYPGWKAYVDGKETTILKANYRFRAVLVPAGNHEVSFSYEPFWFKVGMVITISTLLVFAGIFAANFLLRLGKPHL